MSVVLLEPFIDDRAKWGRFGVEKGYIVPLGMVALYSYLKARGIPVRLVDTQFGEYDKGSLRALLSREPRPKVIGIPVFTSTADFSFETARLCREAAPSATIVLGGVHATSLPERTLEECPSADYVVIGEGEHTLHELVARVLEGKPADDVPGICRRSGAGPVRNPPRALMDDLDSLPFSAYEELDLPRYVPHPTQYRALPSYPMLTSRGCPFRCIFCEAHVVHGYKVRRFSVGRVIEEMRVLVRRFGARGIYFQDSTFTTDREYTLELMGAMVREDFRLQWACNSRVDRVDPELLAAMKRAGCWMISYGMESANQESLDLLKKGITVEQIRKAAEMTERAGISMLCNWILALPGEDRAKVLNTIALAKSIRSDMALFYLPTPCPGSELYRVCRETGGLREGAPWTDYLSVDFDNPVYKNPLIPAEEMKSLYRKAYVDYYRDPRYLLKMLLRLRSMDDIRRCARGLRAVVNAFK